MQIVIVIAGDVVGAVDIEEGGVGADVSGAAEGSRPTLYTVIVDEQAST